MLLETFSTVLIFLQYINIAKRYNVQLYFLHPKRVIKNVISCGNISRRDLN